jgi:hypothetical protein
MSVKYTQCAVRPGPPMTLGNMRERGVQNLIAFCLNDACRQQALIDVASYPAETQLAAGKMSIVADAIL